MTFAFLKNWSFKTRLPALPRCVGFTAMLTATESRNVCFRLFSATQLSSRTTRYGHCVRFSRTHDDEHRHCGRLAVGLSTGLLTRLLQGELIPTTHHCFMYRNRQSSLCCTAESGNGLRVDHARSGMQTRYSRTAQLKLKPTATILLLQVCII